MHWKGGKQVAAICNKHGFYHGEHCPMCVEEIKGDGPQMMFFTPHTYEDLGLSPVHITSKRQLKEICKRRNLKAARLQ